MERKEIQKQIEKVLGEDYKVVCLTDKKIGNSNHRTWAIIEKNCKSVEALFDATDENIYSVKYCEASVLKELALIDKTLKQNRC